MVHTYDDHHNNSDKIRVVEAKEDTRDTHYQSTKSAPDRKRYNSQKNIRIDAVGLRKVGKNKVVLLNDISLSIPGGALVAFVGSSGSGKSTLLNALSGFQVPQIGKVLYGGQDYYRDLSVYRKQLGYVPQDNIVHQNLTVERALYYAAKMRLPVGYTNKRIKQRINEVIDDVNLTAHRPLLVNKLIYATSTHVSLSINLTHQ